MKTLPKKTNGSRTHARKGAAAVEFALVAPLLVILVLGSVDVGQFINTSQILNGASREGARQASLIETTTTADVESAVQEYISDAFPSTATSDLNAAITVNVLNSDGAVISGIGLSSVPSGDPVSVQVLFTYDTVRTIAGFAGINGSSLEKTTVMRRE